MNESLFAQHRNIDNDCTRYTVCRTAKHKLSKKGTVSFIDSMWMCIGS